MQLIKQLIITEVIENTNIYAYKFISNNIGV